MTADARTWRVLNLEMRLDEPESQVRERAARAAGIDPYPARVRGRIEAIGIILRGFDVLSRRKKEVVVAGRVMGVRDQGGVLFLDVRDESGSIQAVLKKDSLADFNFLKSVLDRGDFVATSGPLFKTKKGERSVEVKEFRILAKSLRPLPDTWYGLEETETRLRQRYLDLLINQDVAGVFRKKAIFWQGFRDRLRQEGFLEVETPVLEPILGGAEAEPFKTHHNALDMDLYLRISLELSLKKLLIGGFEKVFEIGRIFRNEGIDREHLQDYTQLEFYWAYRDYRDLMAFVEKMYKSVIKKVAGGFTTKHGGKSINWGKKWALVDYVAEFKKASGLDPLTASPDALERAASALDIEIEPHFGKGRLIDLIFKKAVRPRLIQPCFLIDPPVEVEPLAKRLAADPRRVERVQVMACGTELGKGFSELNDPIDQRARFEEQMKLRQAGDKEAQQLDEDFLTALEYGMPPAAGFGVSERLFSVLMDKPIRETVVFPLVRPKNS